MRGHIRERSPGHWAIVIDVRDPTTGKRKRRWHSFKGTKREAQIECARLVTERKGGAYIDPTRVTGCSLPTTLAWPHSRASLAPQPRMLWGDRQYQHRAADRECSSLQAAARRHRRHVCDGARKWPPHRCRPFPSLCLPYAPCSFPSDETSREMAIARTEPLRCGLAP
jgi:hypothetical protein